jgi:hypothetical protein
MAKHSLLVGSTSWIDYVRITDVNGSPITGLLWNSTGLLSKYVLSGAASVAITLATQTVTGAWSSGGFVEVDATAFPGLYRLDVPNAAIASGNKAYISLYGYSGMNVSMLEYDLWAINPQDSVRAGLTALPNAAAAASGGLLTVGTSAGQITPTGGKVNTATCDTLTTYTGDTPQTGDSFARLGAAGAGLTALGDTRIANLDATVSSRLAPAGTLAAVTLVSTLTTYTGSTPQTGDSFARLGTPVGASISADVAAVKAQAVTINADTDDIQTRLPAALVSGRMDSSVGAYPGNTVQTGDSFARIGAPVGASISADIAAIEANAVAIKAKTDNLPASPAATGAQMDLVNAPNATAVTAIQSGLATSSALTTVGSNVTSVKAKTDNLPSDPADASDIASSFSTVNTTLATIAGYVDTEVAAIKAKTDLIPAAPAAVGDIPTANQNADALLDRTAGVETGVTLRQAQRVQLASAAGKLSGAASALVKIRDTADTKDRVTAVVDADGNRTTVTLDLS